MASERARSGGARRRAAPVGGTQLARWRGALLPLFLALCYVPFWDKAFHIDDGAYLHLSTLYEWNPLEVHASDYVYLGVPLEGLLPYESSHPFLVPYLIKAARALVGSSERALHVVFTGFAVLALTSLLALNRELFPQSRRAQWLLPYFFLPLPIFLIPSHSVMTDLPTLAFLLASAALYARAVERPGPRAYAAAGVTLALALASSYQAVLLLPALALYARLRGRLRVGMVLALVLPCAAFGAWLLAVYLRHGVFYPLQSAQPESGFSLAQEWSRAVGSEGERAAVLATKAVHLLAVLGSSFAILMALRARLARRGAAFARAAFLGTGLALLALQLSGLTAGYPFHSALLLALFVALGLAGLGMALRGGGVEVRPGHGSKMAFLGVWAVTMLLFGLVVLPFSAARYHLLGFVPLFLLLWNGVPWSEARRHAKAVAGAALLTAVLGLACAAVDAKHAGVYRDYARWVAAEPRAGELWYIAEWGMRHYMQEEGARYLLRETDEVEVGDRIVLPLMQRFSWPPGDLSPRVQKVERASFGSPIPVRPFNKPAHAGFWAHGWGLLPFAFSLAPLEEFEVYDVVRPPTQ